MRLDTHISEEELRKFALIGMNSEKDLVLLEHISLCDDCNQKYISYIEDDLLSLPTDFEVNMLSKIHSIRQGNIISIKEHKKTYYRYCVRVATACACSILLLFNLDKAFSESALNQMTENQIATVLQEKMKHMKGYFIESEDNKE